MIVTEEQAKNKWCPMSRVADISDGDGEYIPVGYNRWSNGDISLGSYCIGSECMAWVEYEGYCGLIKGKHI